MRQVSERVVLAQKAYILFYIQRAAPAARLPAFLAPPTQVASSTAGRAPSAAPLTVAPRPTTGGASATQPALVSASRGPVANGTAAPSAPTSKAVQPKQQQQQRAEGVEAPAQLRSSSPAAMSGQQLSSAQPAEGGPVLVSRRILGTPFIIGGQGGYITCRGSTLYQRQSFCKDPTAS